MFMKIHSFLTTNYLALENCKISGKCLRKHEINLYYPKPYIIRKKAWKARKKRFLHFPFFVASWSREPSFKLALQATPRAFFFFLFLFFLFFFLTWIQQKEWSKPCLAYRNHGWHYVWKHVTFSRKEALNFRIRGPWRNEPPKNPRNSLQNGNSRDYRNQRLLKGSR